MWKGSWGERSSLDGIARVREAVDPAVPAIVSGDVRSRADAERMIAFCGVDGVAVGRAALTEPWIFASLADADRNRSRHAIPALYKTFISLVPQAFSGLSIPRSDIFSEGG